MDTSGGIAAVAQRKIINLQTYIITDLQTYALKARIGNRRNPLRHWVSTIHPYETTWQQGVSDLTYVRLPLAMVRRRMRFSLVESVLMESGALPV